MFGSLRDVRIPLITTQQMREVDRLMTEKYGIQLLQLMENAGRNLAELVRKLLGNSVQDKHVIVARERETTRVEGWSRSGIWLVTCTWLISACRMLCTAT